LKYLPIGQVDDDDGNEEEEKEKEETVGEVYTKSGWFCSCNPLAKALIAIPSRPFESSFG